MSNLDVKKVIKALELCRYDPDPGQEPKYPHSCMKCPYGQPDLMCAQMFTDAIRLLEKRRWTPFNKRTLTPEEKALHPDWVYIIDDGPEYDETELLVTDGKNVWSDYFVNDGTECYLDSGREIEEGMAWMYMPEPYKEAEDVQSGR